MATPFLAGLAGQPGVQRRHRGAFGKSGKMDVELDSVGASPLGLVDKAGNIEAAVFYGSYVAPHAHADLHLSVLPREPKHNNFLIDPTGKT